MKKLTDIIRIILFLVLGTAIAKAQPMKKTDTDTELWSGVGFTYVITKDLEFDFGQEFRFDENINSFGQSVTDFGLSYDVFDFLSVKAAYRYRSFSSYSRQELYGNISTGFDLGDFKFSYRFRYHRKYSEMTDSPEQYRNKFEIGYKYDKRLDPFVSADFFYSSLGEDKEKFYKVRYSLGTKIELTRYSDIELCYMLEDMLYSDKIVSILGINWSYKLY